MAEIHDYKCPCCGGSVEFDSSSQKLKCPYCGTEFDVKTVEDYNREAQNQKPSSMEWETPKNSEWDEEEKKTLHSYICKSCGGQLVADKNTSATTCPFCGSPVVINSRVSGTLRPDLIIPFRLNKKQAKKEFEKYLSDKAFLPKVFSTQQHISEIKGVYVPFWLFEANAEAQIKYDATRIRMYSDARYNYIETSHYLVHRAGTLKFADVPVDGSSQMPDDLMESVEPFDTSKAKPFSTDYLAGFLANRYDVSKEKSINRANDRIKRSTEEEFAETVGAYAEAHPISSNIQLYNGKARYALYPVWILTTSWNGENYIFAMNGQTGKFVGNLPVDTKAAAVWLITRGLLISLIIYAVIFLLHLISII